MAEVVSLTNKPVDDGRHDAAKKLRDLAARIEAGEIGIEAWILCVVMPGKTDPSRSLTHSFDSGLTVSEAVYVLSGSIHDLHEAVRRP